MNGKILQLSDVDIKDYMNNIDYLQTQLLPELKKISEITLKNTNTNLSEINSLTKTLRDYSSNFNTQIVAIEKSTEHSLLNTELIENLNVKLNNISSLVSDDISKKITDHADKVGIDLKKDIEISKQNLNLVMMELSTLAGMVQKDILSIKAIVPEIDTKEIEKTMKNAIRKSINYNKVEEIFDEYAGKVSYFAEKTREYEGSMLIFDKASKNISKFTIAISLIAGIFSGVALTIGLKWYFN
jgi:methyl-accepting chemotaxis protein